MKFLKKHYKLVIFGLICFVIFVIYQTNNKNNINYTSLGDSFALGEDSYGRIDYGYSDYLKDKLESNERLNHYIKSFSTKNMSVEMLYENIMTNKKIKIKGKEINIKQTLRETSILTISIGLNDLIYYLSVTNNLSNDKVTQIVETVYESFEKLITEIRKYYPHQIYVVGYYNINNSNPYLKQAIKKLNKKYAKNKEINFIDTYNLFEQNPFYLSNPNNIHPNHLGHRAIAKQILTKIPKTLEK